MNFEIRSSNRSQFFGPLGAADEMSKALNSPGRDDLLFVRFMEIVLAPLGATCWIDMFIAIKER